LWLFAAVACKVADIIATVWFGHILDAFESAGWDGGCCRRALLRGHGACAKSEEGEEELARDEVDEKPRDAAIGRE